MRKVARPESSREKVAAAHRDRHGTGALHDDVLDHQCVAHGTKNRKDDAEHHDTSRRHHVQAEPIPAADRSLGKQRSLSELVGNSEVHRHVRHQVDRVPNTV